MFWYFVILVLFNLVFLGDLQLRMNVMSGGGGGWDGRYKWLLDPRITKISFWFENFPVD